MDTINTVLSLDSNENLTLHNGFDDNEVKQALVVTSLNSTSHYKTANADDFVNDIFNSPTFFPEYCEEYLDPVCNWEF